MVEAVLFDFNGTMIFDAAVNRRAWDRQLERLIGRRPTNEEFAAHIQGVNGRDTIRYFLGADVSDDEADALGRETDRLYREELIGDPHAFRLVDGLPAFLDALGARGVRLNICSAAIPENMDLFFGHLDLGRWFDRTLVALNDGSLPGKPAPDIYLAGARALGVDPHACAVFEDAASGVAAAHAAGVRAIVGVTSGMTRAETLALPGVTAAIADYADLDALMGYLV